MLLSLVPSEEDSVFDESDIHDTPTGAGNKESQTFFARLKRIGGSKSVKYQPVELNAKKSKEPLHQVHRVKVSMRMGSIS